MPATVSGALGQSKANLSYDPATLAAVQAAALKAIGETSYKTAVYYDPATWQVSEGTQKSNITASTEITPVAGAAADNLHLGSGSATIDALARSNVIVEGGASSFKLSFVGGAISGSVGDKLIVGAHEAVTVVGGADDTLMAGVGTDRLVAGHGNETLIGGAGKTVFDLTTHKAISEEGHGSTIQILDFSSKDVLVLGSSSAEEYALSTFHVVGGNGMFLLDDGTKVVLHGFTALHESNFKG
jgi:hypothetical protein